MEQLYWTPVMFYALAAFLAAVPTATAASRVKEQWQRSALTESPANPPALLNLLSYLPSNKSPFC